MSGTPEFKVHNPQGEYIAACKHVEDAAAVIASYGDGARLKWDGKIMWREGAEPFSAGGSYDAVAAVVAGRIMEWMMRREHAVARLTDEQRQRCVDVIERGKLMLSKGGAL